MVSRSQEYELCKGWRLRALRLATATFELLDNVHANQAEVERLRLAEEVELEDRARDGLNLGNPRETMARLLFRGYLPQFHSKPMPPGLSPNRASVISSAFRTPPAAPFALPEARTKPLSNAVQPLTQSSKRGPARPRTAQARLHTPDTSTLSNQHQDQGKQDQGDTLVQPVVDEPAEITRLFDEMMKRPPTSIERAQTVTERSDTERERTETHPASANVPARSSRIVHSHGSVLVDGSSGFRAFY